jgi:hypothetical protein
LIAGFLTACFTVIMQQAKPDPIHAAALVSTGSLVIYAPIISRCMERDSSRCRSPMLPFRYFSGRGSQHRLSGSVWPCGGDPGRFGRLGIWGVGTSAIGAARGTAGWRVADQSGLVWHRANPCRCVSGERRTITGLDASGDSSSPKGIRLVFHATGAASTTYLPSREEDRRRVIECGRLSNHGFSSSAHWLENGCLW